VRVLSVGERHVVPFPGRGGVALRNAGWQGAIIGLDLSAGMLDIAASAGAYDALVQCSLYDLPVDDRAAAAVISTGVFTHGHVTGRAFGELARITRATGVVCVTQRVDLEAEHRPHAQALEAAGRWHELDRSQPDGFHPTKNQVEQVLVTWQVAATS